MSTGGKLYYVGLLFALLSPAAQLYLLVQQTNDLIYLATSGVVSICVFVFALATYRESKKFYNFIRSSSAESQGFHNPMLQKAAHIFAEKSHDIIDGLTKAEKLVGFRSDKQMPKVSECITLLAELIEAGSTKAEIDKWHAAGLARLSEILRTDFRSLEELASATLNFCANYSNSKQGILFIIDDSAVELRSCASYARLNNTISNVKYGEGTIGQVFINQQPLFIDHVPEAFYKIESGLGSASPKSAAILPLVTGSDVVGILELAAFEIYPHHIRQWLVGCSEAIATTIRSKLSNEKIKRVLRESEEKTIALTTREHDLERIKFEQAEEINRLNLRHDENLKLVEQKVKEAELAKADVENIRALERDRQKKQNETQSKIIQATIDKFKAQERQLQDVIKGKDETIRLLTEEIESMKINVKP